MALGKSAQEDIAQFRKTADRLNAPVVALNEQMLQRCCARERRQIEVAPLIRDKRKMGEALQLELETRLFLMG